LSVRCANSAGIISKSRIVPSTDGNTPEFRLTINQERYNTVSKIFGDREIITIGELVEKLFNK